MTQSMISQGLCLCVFIHSPFFFADHRGSIILNKAETRQERSCGRLPELILG